MRHRRKKAVGLAAACVASSVMLSASPARAGDAAAAREQVKIGYQLAQDGKCAEAIPHFVESLHMDAKAITLINLAACEEKTSRLADALGHWVDARAHAQAEGNAAIEAEAEKKTKALEPRLPKLTIVLAGATPDAEVVRDGVVLGAASMGVALPVNPGAHTLVVRASGHEDKSASVTIAESENKRIELTLGAPKAEPRTPIAGPPGQPDHSSRGTSPLVYAGFGAAIAGAAVGTIFGVITLGRASDAKTACPAGACTSQSAVDDAKSGQTFGTISTVGFIVAGAGAAVGVYGLVWGRPRSSTSVAVSVGPTGGALRGTF
jgi:hypothetical protein